MAEEVAKQQTIRLAPEGPSGRVLVWVCTVVLVGVSGSLVIEAFFDEGVSPGKRAVVTVLALLACLTYGATFSFIRRWWGMESQVHVTPERLVIEHPWYFRKRISVPMERVDFVAVDVPDQEFTRLAFPCPPEFPVSWTVENLPATKGQHLAPGEVNFAIVFDGPVHLPELRPLAKQGLVRRVAALFGHVTNPLEASGILADVVTVRTLRSEDIGKISTPRGERASLWFWRNLTWLLAMVIAIGPLLLEILYSPGR